MPAQMNGKPVRIRLFTIGAVQAMMRICRPRAAEITSIGIALGYYAFHFGTSNISIQRPFSPSFSYKKSAS